MTTGSEYVNITSKGILGLEDFKDRFFDYLKGVVKTSVGALWNVDGVFDTALTLSGTAANEIQVNGTSKATDGLGNVLDVNNIYPDRKALFENTTAIDYYVGMEAFDRPVGIRINPRTGKPEYEKWREGIGESGAPNSVTDNGNGTITFNVNDVTEAGVTNAGRKVLVWKNVPADGATSESIAIEELTVAYSGPNNTITTSANSLGQSTISTTASDYTVALLGVSVKRNTDLRTSPTHAFIGIVTGNAGTPTAFDESDQRILKTFSDASQILFTPYSILTAFNVQAVLQQAADAIVANTANIATNTADIAALEEFEEASELRRILDWPAIVDNASATQLSACGYDTKYGHVLGLEQNTADITPFCLRFSPGGDAKTTRQVTGAPTGGWDMVPTATSGIGPVILDKGDGTMLVGAVTVNASALKVAVSTDGGAFAVQSLNDASAGNGVACGVYDEYYGRFYVGLTTTGTANIEWSSSGTSWTARSGTSYPGISDIATDHNGTIIATLNSSSDQLLRSTDGSTFTARTLPASATWVSVAYCPSNGKWFASDGSANYAVSTDGGLNWSAATFNSGGITFGGRPMQMIQLKYHLVCIDNGGDVWFSKDGENWKPVKNTNYASVVRLYGDRRAGLIALSHDAGTNYEFMIGSLAHL